MNPTLRNVLAVIAGIIVCMALNSLLLNWLMGAIGTPAGFDPNAVDTFQLLETRHYLAPFAAHALPSLVGGFLAALLGTGRRMLLALVVGSVHMLGGLAAAFIIPAPGWFIALDLVVAYLPMAWLGGRLAQARTAG